ncbi:SRPBCC family protein [Microbulbifer sp. TYP-18]|uniref:SRPBCC family protein n=1 Tax=Microbulbifer sp. TYP-18 TaxID=3230024 RepID=UPI0034C61384
MRWILYTLGFLILLVFAGFLFPRQVTVERSVYIAKPPPVVFPYVNNFHNFNRWSPWYHLDPETQYSYGGAAEGVGASMSWSSDSDDVGSGSQTITASEPFSLVRTSLDFDGQGTAVAEFRLQPQGSGTNITWSFSSDMGEGPVARWMGVVVKNMVGESYGQGLQKLKAIAESSPDPSSPPAATAGGESDSDTSPGASTQSPAQNSAPVESGSEPADSTMLEEEAEEPVEENRH